MKAVTIYLTEDQHALLRKQAFESNVSMSFIIRGRIDAYKESPKASPKESPKSPPKKEPVDTSAMSNIQRRAQGL